MSSRPKHKASQRRKKLSVRRRVRAFTARPRLSVFRSLGHIYAQVIDDEQGRTLAAASTVDKTLRDEVKSLRKTDAAAKVGALVAERAKGAGVTQVAFDRGPYKYHGRVKALADAAREGGLEF